jgi:hypothetical protein
MKKLNNSIIIVSIFLSSGLSPQALTMTPSKKMFNLATDVTLTTDVANISLFENSASSKKFRVHMVLRLNNKSSKPIIILSDSPLIGDIWLAQSKDDAQSQRYIYESSRWPSRDDSPRWKQLHKQLDQKEPPQGITLTIAPGENWEFERDAEFAITKSGSFDKRSKPWQDIQKINPLWFQIRLLMWPNNLEKRMLDPEFGKQLERRWRAQGWLVIDNILSEPVSLKLPNEPRLN